MDDSIRVLVAGDATEVVDALRTLAPLQPRVDVLGPVHPSSLPATLDRTPAHLVVLATDGRELVGALERLGAGESRVRILVVGQADPGVVALTLAAGGCGVIPPDLGPEEIRVAVLRACAGELILEDGDLKTLVQRIADARGRSGIGMRSLTDREVEVLQALARGGSTAEIAEVMGISPLTVQSHVKNVLAKLGVHSKVEAVRLAWREGLASVPA